MKQFLKDVWNTFKIRITMHDWRCFFTRTYEVLDKETWTHFLICSRCHRARYVGLRNEHFKVPEKNFVVPCRLLGVACMGKICGDINNHK